MSQPRVRQGLIRALLDFLFPPRCVGCEQRGDWLCQTCLDALPRLPPERCARCGQPAIGRICHHCRTAPPAFAALHCEYIFTGTLRAAIHRLKYRRCRELAEPLGQLMLTALTVAPARGPAGAPPIPALSPSRGGKGGGDAPAAPEVVIPVPLHSQRLAERGFNQAELLAVPLATGLGVPLATAVLRRSRNTQPQMSLPAARRRENVVGAFEATPAIAGVRVLLVDDVCTTGSTLSAAASALQRAGARRVEAAALARAV
ncbi:MAG: ComF family protein [Chloroflexi bacterium]|nr:ComF family protein [Chloroflexota bacterium]